MIFLLGKLVANIFQGIVSYEHIFVKDIFYFSQKGKNLIRRGNCNTRFESQICAFSVRSGWSLQFPQNLTDAICATVVAQIPWGRNIALLGKIDPSLEKNMEELRRVH